MSTIPPKVLGSSACSLTSHPAASLTREESSWLWESPEAHTRCHIALSQLLDLLCRMGLLSSGGQRHEKPEVVHC